ncbi:DegQ family serine endoprotease [Accumulibacter sp.]|uniref:DegQ family serine endoprotease n=1 Tax=Accumulibacter sp. TaxID=2053492 RepID=UPI0025E2AA2F|nr:DegQ family serine endoprotease [Accumulibacter sp.]MCM8625207.1 DegQ family serine endoprotease [Accumulibacter sp.]
MDANKLKLTASAAAVVAALTGAYTLGHANSPASQASASQVTAPITMSQPAAAARAELPDMSGIVARNSPSVVNISVSGTRKAGSRGPRSPQFDDDQSIPDFLRRFGAPHNGGDAPARGLGSGFIVSPDGTILTNAHVVDGAEEVIVKLTDKREFKAKVLGLDTASDVAVLKIDAKDLPVVRIGSAANTRVGEWVLAIGSPFGFESSASAGIVSAFSRSLPDGSYVPFIQTDVAVNPGNSGGPLFNMAGEVIGINSQIYSRSGGYQGLSFAIPIEVAMNVERQIVAHGKVQRGRLGVAIQEVNQSLADSFGLKKPAGALVGSVDRDSPAAKAGLQPGDVILSINGKEIASSNELPAIVSSMKPGEQAKLQVWRKGETRAVDVEVGKFGDQQLASNDAPDADKGRLGVVVRPLTPEEQRRSDVGNGVMVQNVAGAAAKAGIQPGDIVIAVNGEAISSTEQLRSLISKAGKRIAVLVDRGNARIFIPVDLG